MRIIILGIDGYIGWPLALHLLSKGHHVFGLDNYIRRNRICSAGSDSLTPISTKTGREAMLRSQATFDGFIARVDVTDYYNLSRVISHYKPDTIVHLAEQPSAPWSMMSPQTSARTQQDNVIGTLNILWVMKEYCPEAHLVKLGTMGEYGTPNCEIPEGEIPDKCIDPVIAEMQGWIPADREGRPISQITEESHCPMAGLPFPKSPNSFYHLSKVHDTNNIIFACRNWGLRSTDIMQGIVFGLNKTDNPNLLTRFDYDEYFGTVINRFCVQAIIGHPLTVYGRGFQQRGFLPLKDSIQCLTLAIENIPELGEYRTFNQFENIYSINKVAAIVSKMYGLPSQIDHIHNPRNESEDHYYNPAHQKLFNLGYKPTTDIQGEIRELIETILPFRDKVKIEVILPKTNWR